MNYETPCFAHSFRDLVAHRKARQLAKDAFTFTLSLPRNDEFSLKDQIRRASRSIGAQIAEAWAKRRYEKHFISKLTDADAEQMEMQHWMDIASDCGYLKPSDYQRFIEQLEEINRLIHGMINKASMFSGDKPKALHEETAPCFTS